MQQPGALGIRRFLERIQSLSSTSSGLKACKMPERSGDGISLFQCALPYPEVLRIEAAGEESEVELIWAKQLLNTFVAWSDFVTLGCPEGTFEPRVTYRSLDEARAFSDRLLGEAREFASMDLVLGRLRCEVSGRLWRHFSFRFRVLQMQVTAML